MGAASTSCLAQKIHWACFLLIALFISRGRPSPAISTSCSCFQFLSPWYEHIWRYERQPHGKLLSPVLWQKLHDHLTVRERMLHLALISFTQDNPDYEHAGVGWAYVQIFLFLKTFGACYSGGTRSQHSSLWNFNTSGYNHHLICGKTNFGSSPNSSCFVLSTCRWAYPSHTGQSSNDHDDLFLTSQHPTGTDDLGGFCLSVERCEMREWIVAVLSSQNGTLPKLSSSLLCYCCTTWWLFLFGAVSRKWISYLTNLHK